jgi:hypothetical protein
MKHFRTVGMFVVAALALAAVGPASAAAAEPALYECHKEAKGHGKYSKGCTAEKEGGGYEIKEGFGKGKAFKAKAKGANFNVQGLGGIDCTAGSGIGKFTSPATGTVTATFTGCELDGKKCESGAKAGEVVTNPLKGIVGYLAGKGTKNPKVGSDFSAETGEILGEAHCGSLTIAVTGSVIDEVKPVNTWSKTSTLIFKSSKLVQEWPLFEGGPEDTLLAHVCETEGCNPFTAEGGFTAEMTLETTIVNKGEDMLLKA